MKTKIFLLLTVFSFLFLAGLVSAAEAETTGGEGAVMLINLIMLVVIGGIIYNIWVNASGFGGMLGNAIKVMGVGIFLLSIDTVDEVVEGITGFGSESVFGEGLAHDVFHSLLLLLGFFVIGFGLSKMTKLIKALK